MKTYKALAIENGIVSVKAGKGKTDGAAVKATADSGRVKAMFREALQPNVAKYRAAKETIIRLSIFAVVTAIKMLGSQLPQTSQDDLMRLATSELGRMPENKGDKGEYLLDSVDRTLSRAVRRLWEFGFRNPVDVQRMIAKGISYVLARVESLSSAMTLLDSMLTVGLINGDQRAEHRKYVRSRLDTQDTGKDATRKIAATVLSVPDATKDLLDKLKDSIANAIAESKTLTAQDVKSWQPKEITIVSAAEKTLQTQLEKSTLRATKLAAQIEANKAKHAAAIADLKASAKARIDALKAAPVKSPTPVVATRKGKSWTEGIAKLPPVHKAAPVNQAIGIPARQPSTSIGN